MFLADLVDYVIIIDTDRLCVPSRLLLPPILS